MNNELTRLSCTAGKERSEDGNIQPTLEGCESHLGVGNDFGRTTLVALGLKTGAPTSRDLGSIIGGKVGGVHGDDAADALGEHALPLTFTDLFAVIGTSESLGGPFLLEECTVRGGRASQSLQIIQVVFAP